MTHSITESSTKSTISLTSKPTPLPKKEILVLSCVMISEAISITMLFPFVGFMVSDFGIADSAKEIGYYGGLIASSFNIAQFISSFFWGSLSDRYGRRPILLFGLLGNTLTIVLFGYSNNLAMALIFRSLNGLLNGNTGVAKTYIREITDSTNEAKGFAFINLIWGLGAIIGPTVGGLLANPVESYPSIFDEGSHFDDHPYVLPCILSSFFSLFGLVTGYFFLRETLARKASTESLPLLEPSTKDEYVPLPSQREVLKSLLRDKLVMSSVMLYGIVAFVEIVFDEIQSFWLMLSPAEGGCGFSSKEIGIQIAITGILLIIFQTLLYHKLSDKVGILHLFRCSLIGLAISLTAYPFTSKLAYDNDGINLKLWSTLLPLGLLKTWCGGAVFSTTMVMISNSTTTDKIGAVNGLGQSVAALLRAAGPAVGGSLFAWSNTNGMEAPFDYHLVFFLMGLICIATSFSSTGLPKSLEKRKE